MAPHKRQEVNRMTGSFSEMKDIFAWLGVRRQADLAAKLWQRAESVEPETRIGPFDAWLAGNKSVGLAATFLRSATKPVRVNRTMQAIRRFEPSPSARGRGAGASAS